ncbi:MAG: HNH endonuclease [bacterium]|nr:HNH endonuclease [bacterium]
MNIPKDFKEKLDSVTNKRARFVIDTILEKGYCSTEDLRNGGYEHAPRAARDVRELEIPLETIHIKNSSGKTIAAYKLGNWEQAKNSNILAKTSGRTQLSEKLKIALIARYGCKCNLYGEIYPERLLQPDHRIPYEIGGDPDDMLNTDYFMLLSPSANRDKSWACEHCSNWKVKNKNVCQSCYYAFPEHYTHIADAVERKIDLIFKEDEINLYEEILKQANTENISIQQFTKRMLEYYKNHR